MNIHELKTLPEYFEAVQSGAKTFEVRKNDRGFQVGDLLILRCWIQCPYHGGYFDGSPIRKRVTYVLTGGQFGIEPDYCVLGLGEDK